MGEKNINIRYFHHPVLHGLSASTTEYRHYQFPKHFHNHYTVLLVEEGVNEGFTESRKYRLGQDGILVINPGDLHAGNSLEGRKLKFNSLRIEEHFLRQFCVKNEMDRTGGLYFNTKPIYDSRLAATMRGALAKIKKGNTPGADEAISELLFLLLGHHSNRHVRPSHHDSNPSVELARQFIHEHYDTDFSLDDLSRSSCLSPYHLIRQFKKEYGLTPFQYLRNLRVEKAKPLLARGEITRAANEVGFYDHSHFLKAYKQVEGAPPSRYTRATPLR